MLATVKSALGLPPDEVLEGDDSAVEPPTELDPLAAPPETPDPAAPLPTDEPVEGELPADI